MISFLKSAEAIGSQRWNSPASTATSWDPPNDDRPPPDHYPPDRAGCHGIFQRLALGWDVVGQHMSQCRELHSDIDEGEGRPGGGHIEHTLPGRERYEWHSSPFAHMQTHRVPQMSVSKVSVSSVSGPSCTCSQNSLTFEALSRPVSPVTSLQQH